MSESFIQSPELEHLMTRVRAGDRAARDELFRSVCRRLEHLARKMLRHFPDVKRSTEAEDVVQDAVVRLLGALDRVELTTMQHFLKLAAFHVRRQLLDLARQLRGPKGRASGRARPWDDASGQGDLEASTGAADDPGEVERWYAFHHEVEQLPAAEREVVGLIYYHGWTHAQVAELFQVSVRTIRRRWNDAFAKLQRLLRE